MPQLGRYQDTFTTGNGAPVVGGQATVYREGGTVNGNQSGVSPLAVTVRHPGKIVAGDTVFVGTATGTTYAVTATTATSATLAGFGGLLTLNNGDRLVPANSLPTLFSDDFGGATTANPLITDGKGRVNCWINLGNYDVILAAGSLSTLFQSQAVFGEAPAALISGEVDGATAVGHVLDTYYNLANASAKLLSIRNLGAEKFSVGGNGGFTAGQASIIAAGGLTVTSGGLTVSAGGAAVTGASSVSGGSLSITSPGATTPAVIALVGNLKATAADLEVRRLFARQGNTIQNADITLSAGWGNTATFAIGSAAQDSRGAIQITANGTGIAANPTVTLIYHDGAYSIGGLGAAPFYVVSRTDGAAPTTGWFAASNLTFNQSTSSLIATFVGLPVAGNIYSFNYVVVG